MYFYILLHDTGGVFLSNPIWTFLTFPTLFTSGSSCTSSSDPSLTPYRPHTATRLSVWKQRDLSQKEDAFKSHTFWCRFTLQVLTLLGEQSTLREKKVFLAKWPSSYFSLQLSCFYLILYHCFYRFCLFCVHMYQQRFLAKQFRVST
jgi:hypothetical protein